jgi:hypothetical protein
MRFDGITCDYVDWWLAGLALGDEELGPKFAEVSPGVNKQSTNSTTNNGGASNVVQEEWEMTYSTGAPATTDS